MCLVVAVLSGGAGGGGGEGALQGGAVRAQGPMRVRGAAVNHITNVKIQAPHQLFIMIISPQIIYHNYMPINYPTSI